MLAVSPSSPELRKVVTEVLRMRLNTSICCAAVEIDVISPWKEEYLRCFTNFAAVQMTFNRVRIPLCALLRRVNFDELANFASNGDQIGLFFVLSRGILCNDKRGTHLTWNPASDISLMVKLSMRQSG